MYTFRKGRLRLQDLAIPPSLQEVGTMMRAGVVLSARVLISFGMVMYASALCVRMGSTTQASFEVVRQVGAALSAAYCCAAQCCIDLHRCMGAVDG
jgi:hypothetical protein